MCTGVLVLRNLGLAMPSQNGALCSLQKSHGPGDRGSEVTCEGHAVETRSRLLGVSGNQVLHRQLSGCSHKAPSFDWKMDQICASRKEQGPSALGRSTETRLGMELDRTGWRGGTSDGEKGSLRWRTGWVLAVKQFSQMTRRFGLDHFPCSCATPNFSGSPCTPKGTKMRSPQGTWRSLSCPGEQWWCGMTPDAVSKLP